MADSYVIDGYCFQSRGDYDRAKKEKETIAYLSAHVDMADMKAVYKVYKTASEKGSFQTVFGLNYMDDLRKHLVESEIVTEDVLDPIPVGRVVTAGQKKGPKTTDKELGEYQKAYEKAKSGSFIKNLLIVVLLVVIVGMVVITYKNQYSIFTYFTNYKEDMREELLDEYEDWDNTLREREKEIEKKEQELGISPQESPDAGK